MKVLDLSLAVSPNIFFTTSGTINFLQAAYTEVIAQTLIAQIGSNYSTSTPYILYGCVETVGGSTTTFSAGAIFYNGEVYIIPASAPIANPTGGNVFLCTLLVTNNFLEPGGASCDPATFSMSSPSNVHNIRSINYVVGPAGGSGVMNYLFDFSATIPISPILQSWVDLGNTLTVSSGLTFPSGIEYNKYLFTGHTFIWQITINNATISGSPTVISINIPSFFSIIYGYSLTNINCYKIVGTYNSYTPLYAVFNHGNFLLELASLTPFTNGTANQSFSIFIEMEVG